MKPFIRVKCTCCGHVLEIDVARSRVISDNGRAVLPAAGKEGAPAFDAVLDDFKQQERERSSKFDEATERLKHSKARLDNLFDEVVKKVANETKKADEDEKSPDDKKS
jgi:hypothetical protein